LLEPHDVNTNAAVIATISRGNNFMEPSFGRSQFDLLNQ